MLEQLHAHIKMREVCINSPKKREEHSSHCSFKLNLIKFKGIEW